MFNFGNKKLKNSTRPGFDAKAGAGFELGFTLVEIIVVLAIIGLLLTIVMISTGTARKQGKDAAIQSALMELRNAAELYYDNIKSYVGVCAPDPDKTLADTGDFLRIEDFIVEQGGTITCQDSDEAYAVISTLNLENCWCVDSEGSSHKVELEPGETCGAKLTTFSCP